MKATLLKVTVAEFHVNLEYNLNSYTYARSAKVTANTINAC